MDLLTYLLTYLLCKVWLASGDSERRRRSNEAKTRETRWNLPGCPKLVNRSQPLVSRSSPYCVSSGGDFAV